MTTWAALGLQDSAYPLMEQLTFFHDHTLMILVMITTLVGYLMFMLFFNNYTNRNLLHGVWNNLNNSVSYGTFIYYISFFTIIMFISRN